MEENKTDVNVENKDTDKKEPEVTKNILSRVVAPHEKKSREVTEADVERVAKEAAVLFEICWTQWGNHNGAVGMAHPQIEDTDPLAFFVTAERELIVNPVITRHSNTTVDSKEGCISFPGREHIIVQRWNKIELDFYTLMVDPENNEKFKLSSKMHASLSGTHAKIYQHEIDHTNGINIYKKNEQGVWV